ncbi:hypothetical protein L211DRAFT_833528 [Terfezia boudieri ATCC MYA-4762]|uniref:Uncharacterized protein n=1 Tax=Terfezia boudieri ATCC MYA-4762 TaxID=1051890 RepID=A0A3N4M0K4_9PEZI|nr:hypothetical protein L211DRAFT_833528 [Terfezia boudieri ATCC MYA-4762]
MTCAPVSSEAHGEPKLSFAVQETPLSIALRFALSEIFVLFFYVLGTFLPEQSVSRPVREQG